MRRLLLLVLVAAGLVWPATASATTYWFLCDVGICRSEGGEDVRVVMRNRHIEPPSPFGPARLDSFAVTPDERLALASDGNRVFALDLRRGRIRERERAAGRCCAAHVYNFDPRGRRALVRRATLGGSHEVCALTARGRVLDCQGLSNLSSPVWGPRLQIARLHESGVHEQVCVIADGTCRRLLARERAGWSIEGIPTLSPDERTMLVEGWSPSRARIGLFATRTGRRIRTIYEGDTSQWHPLWAPNGRSVLRADVVAYRNEPRGVDYPSRTEVFRIGLRGGRERKVAEVAGELVAVTR